MPFLFVFTPLLNVGWNFNFLYTVGKCVIALVTWGAGLEGYF
jgi:TRAP-type uncharacterized transport system fused permease subunit